MSELQLEQIKSHWDQGWDRYTDPEWLKPVDLPLLVSFHIDYAISTNWVIVKSVYYVTISQDLPVILCKEAITKSSLSLSVAMTFSQDEVPFLHRFGQNVSAEEEVRKAIKCCSSAETPNRTAVLVSFVQA
jgi:hypothetical protein